MTAYTARFSNGRTLTLKNSRREYGFAYHWTGTRADSSPVSGSGFARTLDLARKALNAETAFLRTAPTMPRKAYGVSYITYMRKLIAEWQPGSVDFAEITPVARGEG